ncbi:hypothetical protein POM88_044117 [Heracleum sosnowskyi]|uniref:Uncharacterized protein n=1 Tax=Heracleum sosnowskyi TaxID=360622 RepID=A0AAD8M539_9APIA|nr:hypothetical protein POM88_044117 [Heracleum sosnowskyi]
MLFGWKTDGHLACPHCAYDHYAYNLSHGGKTTWFDNHRKFLHANHPFRKNKNWFTKGKTMTESPPPVRTGEDVYQEIESLGLMKVTELGSDEHNARENLNRRDIRIALNVYLTWVEFWKTEDFQKKYLIQRSNRRIGVDGPSRHTSGSASHRLVTARLKLQYKRDPTAAEIFFVAHTRHLKRKKYSIGEAGEDGMDDEDDDRGEVVWIDKKSERIYFGGVFFVVVQCAQFSLSSFFLQVS